MANKKKNPRTAKPVYAIIVEGQTEACYFHMLKRNEKNIRVNIEPKIPERKSLKDQYEKAKTLVAEGYDKVFWIVDLDAIIMAPPPKKGEKQIDIFLQYQEACKKADKIEIIINQPCLEYWFLTHFEDCNAGFTKCDVAEKLLKKHINGYTKTQPFFTKENHDIYLRLKAHLPNARERSKKQKPFDKDSPARGLTEMHKLFDELLPIPEKK